jgi:nitric oxide reductase large subunit
MGHYYSDRTSFYGIPVGQFLPFNFLRDVHVQTAIAWIGLSWIGSALFLSPAISGAEARGQGFLVDDDAVRCIGLIYFCLRYAAGDEYRFGELAGSR